MTRLADMIVSERDSPFFVFAQAERLLILDVAGEVCSLAQRELLFLHYTLDYSLADVARETGVSRAAVVQMHQRALIRMHCALGRLGISRIRDI